MEKRIENSVLLKTICYFLLFLFLILTGYSGIGYIAYKEMPEIATNKPYYETEAFSERFIQQMDSNLRRLNYRIQTEEEVLSTWMVGSVPIGETVLEGYSDQYVSSLQKGVINYESLYSGMGSSFRYLIIRGDIIVTNVIQTGETDTIEEIIQDIRKDSYHWSYVDGKIETNIQNLQTEKVLYDSTVQDIQKNGDTVYVSYRENATEYSGFEREKAIYDLVQQHYIGYEMLPLFVFLSIILFVYLTISIGHTRRQEGIYLNFSDKIPLGVVLCIFGLAIAAEIFSLYIMFIDISKIMYEEITLPIISILSIVAMIYITGMLAYSTFIRRIKAKVFFRNTIVYQIYSFLKRVIWGNIKKFFDQLSSNWRISICYFGFCIISCILFALALNNGFFLLVLIAWGIWIFSRLLEKLKQLKQLRDMINRIYDGKTDILLKEEEFEGNLKNVAKYLNDIAGGFSNAVEESLKSERMKTELITNVSHDLKTPLTSIINYVDLLKREEIQNEKAKEYIEVLENKSQRLKKLTEDLVEASKASSGNIKLTMEILDVKELINQVTGEFEDKFESKKLIPIITYPEENVHIKADSRYLYRVLENSYSNIAKYAKEDTRVYIDIVKNKKRVLIAIKNISKEQLNISTDELMQRFVRGDTSRNTEGSGLRIIHCKKFNRVTTRKF